MSFAKGVHWRQKVKNPGGKESSAKSCGQELTAQKLLLSFPHLLPQESSSSLDTGSQEAPDPRIQVDDAGEGEGLQPSQESVSCPGEVPNAQVGLEQQLPLAQGL